jgi:hypothetical protein
MRVRRENGSAMEGRTETEDSMRETRKWRNVVGEYENGRRTQGGDAWGLVLLSGLANVLSCMIAHPPYARPTHEYFTNSHRTFPYPPYSSPPS